MPREVREVEEVREAGEVADDTPPTSSTSRTPRTSSSSRGVAAVGETWRVDDEWWRVPIARHYVEVVLEGGKHVMLFEDLTTHDWFIQDI